MKFTDTIIKKLTRIVSNTKQGLIMNRREVEVLMGRGRVRDLDKYLNAKKLHAGGDPVYFRPEVVKAIEMYFNSLAKHEPAPVEPKPIAKLKRDLVPTIGREVGKVPF